MLVTVLSSLLLAAAQPPADPVQAPSESTAVEERSEAMPVEETSEPAPVEEASEPAPPVEAEEEAAPPEKMRKVCRQRTIQDQFGKQKTVKSCRPAPE